MSDFRILDEIIKLLPEIDPKKDEDVVKITTKIAEIVNAADEAQVREILIASLTIKVLNEYIFSIREVLP